MFSPPAGGAATLKLVIDDLRSGDMLPAEPAEQPGRYATTMPNIPYVGPIGWNVVGHSHVG